MNVFIIGINSTIGEQLKSRFEKEGFSVYGTTRRIECCDNKNFFYLDLKNTDDFSLPKHVVADVIIFCASITSINECENNKSLCQKVNVEAHLHLAEIFKEKFDPFFIFISSSCVFSGEKPFSLESDIPNPINFYGKTKAEAEKALSEITQKLAILRFTKILTVQDFLIKKWINDLRNKKIIYPYSNLLLSPVILETAINTIVILSKIRKTGIFHSSGDQDISYYELIKKIAKKIHLDDKLVEGVVKTDENNDEEESLKYTSLDMRNSIECLSINYEKLTTVLNYFLE